MSKLTKLEQDAREHYEAMVIRLDEQDSRIQALPDDIDETEREFHSALFESIQEDLARAKETWERQTAIAKARRTIPPIADDDKDDNDDKDDVRPAAREQVRVGKGPHTYRPDTPNSFFVDQYRAAKGDEEARTRLRRHVQETRDVSTADPGAGVFLPPQYLSDLWADLPREGRPFANIVPNLPLPDGGLSLTVPRLTTGSSVSVQITEADAASETDVDGTLLTVGVRTIAGQNDFSVQAFERTMPGMDQLIFSDLRGAYDQYLDTQLISGTGSASQHLGIRAVSSINTVTYTETTPSVANANKAVYNAIQEIASGRHMRADAIIMHPRRAAWFASSLSSSFPLFQLGALNQAAGSQQAGFVDNYAGLRVVQDANIGVLYGVGTNEDEMYVVRAADLYLMEGPLVSRVFDQVLSGTLQVRAQVRAYSAFISGRQPESICKISGTGLVNPW